MSRVATKRTTFTVSGIDGEVTLAKGETCPEAWAEHVPKGDLQGATEADSQPPRTTSEKPSDEKPTTKAGK